MLRPVLLTAIILLASQPAQAQIVPNAGTQIQQIPPAPVPEKPLPEIRVNKPVQHLDTDTSGVRLQVASLGITGNTLISEAELLAATEFKNGEYTLPQLRAFAARVADVYNQKGYFLTQAYLPAQEIRGGQITIAVIEGRYGMVKLDNSSNLKDGVARHVLAGLDQGDIVESAPLERRLLLLSDIPGVTVRSTLSPGQAVGTSDLLVDLQRSNLLSGSVEADNGGNRFTGQYRFGGSLNVNNPAGNGDQVNLRVLGSTSGLAYGRIGYQVLLGNFTLGTAYSHIRYDLGREFQALDADGTADVASIFGSYPLIRSRRSNLYALIGADAKWFTDTQEATDTESKRQARVVNVALSGNHLDNLGGGGSTIYSAGASVGTLDIRSPVDRAIDDVTAQADGGYSKFQASLARIQNVVGSLSLYGSVRGQLATSNLDSSEKMELGGAYAVRAYPEGEVYGDEGYFATGEVRVLLPEFGIPGRIQLIGFIDHGSVRLAHDPWFTGSNTAKRSGYGAGLNWNAPNNFLIQTSYARKLGDQPSILYDDGKGRFWFRVAKIF
jgi:hemolysin activation/secretion protein